MQRCQWKNLENSEIYKDYHDNQWGVACYDDKKIEELMNNEKIIRNRAKILATIQNAKSYLNVVDEFGSFSDYLWSFTNKKVVYHPFDGKTTHNELSDTVSKDLKKRGFKFMGTVTCYSYLEAVGIMNNHATYCFKHASALLS